jgi:peptidoglycan/xylan/chitin deacetylase (PgdA/CDA1 family)
MLGLLLSTAAASLAAAGYSSMAPRSQLYGRTFLGEGAGSRHLALTFDDGPNDPYTLRLLEVLARHEVRATFFPIGRHAVARPDVLRAVATAGHTVGNHTFNHPLLIFSSPTVVRRELHDCRRAVTDAIGQQAPLFRPPHGGRLPSVLRVVRAEGYMPVMWSVSGYDWRANSSQQIEQKVSSNIRGGDVILLHDGGHLGTGVDRSHTISATDRLIRRYQGEGFSFVTVPEMMASAAAQQN